KNRPTSAAGMKESKASSCSYATWFRLCSLGMIDLTLLGGNRENWNFRKTLGMGYAPEFWNPVYLDDHKIDVSRIATRNRIRNLPSYLKDKLIRGAARVMR